MSAEETVIKGLGDLLQTLRDQEALRQRYQTLYGQNEKLQKYYRDLLRSFEEVAQQKVMMLANKKIWEIIKGSPKLRDILKMPIKGGR